MSEPLLAVKDLNAYYGPAHILQGVSFEMGVEPVAIIGRNGMGKSTLCNAIMGLVPDVKGSVRLEGEELIGRQPYKISNAGIGWCRRDGGSSPPSAPTSISGCSGSSSGGRVVERARLRALPAPRRAEEHRGDAALGRRAADARDRPGAAHATRGS